MTDEGGTLILPAYIKELQDRAPWVPELSLLPREIIMTVDPNAGGSNQMAIWSAVYVAGQMVVRNPLLPIVGRADAYAKDILGPERVHVLVDLDAAVEQRLGVGLEDGPHKKIELVHIAEPPLSL